MKTGTGRPCRHPVVLAAIFAGTLVFPLLLSGCDDHSPVAAPTSTLPAKDSSADPSGDQSTPSVPEYKTDLDLSAEEKKAVEGALVAFDGYIATINRVFSSGGKDIDDAEKYARSGSLESLNSEAKSMVSNQQHMVGVYKAYNVQIEKIDFDHKTSGSNSVSVLFCTKDSEWSVVDFGDPLPSSSPKGITMQHVITYKDCRWKVANQYLRSKACESV